MGARELTGGKVRCGARGVEVRALRGGLTLVSITQNMLNRQLSSRYVD